MDLFVRGGNNLFFFLSLYLRNLARVYGNEVVQRGTLHLCEGNERNERNAQFASFAKRKPALGG